MRFKGLVYLGREDMPSCPLSFKIIAVQRLRDGEPLSLVSRSLGIPAQTLIQWAGLYRERTTATLAERRPANIGPGGVVRDRCPHCGSKWRKQSHSTSDPLVIEVYHQCANILCSFAALGVITLLNELTPSKMVNLDILARTPPLADSPALSGISVLGIESTLGEI